MADHLVYYLTQVVIVAYHYYLVVGHYFAVGLALALCPLQIACFLGHALYLFIDKCEGGLDGPSYGKCSYYTIAIS